MVFISDHVAAAIQFQQAGNLAAAEQIYRHTIAAEPNNAAAWHLLGTVAFQVGRHNDAAACIARALQIEPTYAEALNTMGLVYRARGDGERAAACFRLVTAQNPSLAEAHLNLGNVLKDQQQLDEAVASYWRALEVKPAYSDALSNLAGVLKDQGRFDEAIALYRRALVLEPNFRETHYSLGVAFWDAGKVVEASSSISRAIELSPDYAKARHSLSMLRLLQGDFPRGWAEYEWRWKTGQLSPRNFTQPLWDGHDLAGQTIVLHSEQGFGDTIQFVRYAKIVKNYGGTVILQCEPELLHLLASAPGIDRLIPRGEKLPPFDTHAPLLSLPRILTTTLNTIPSQVPYLFPQPSLVEQWRDRLPTQVGYRVGINWQSKPGPGLLSERNMPFGAFAKLAAIAGVQLISLQKGEGQVELASSPSRNSIMALGDFDTAHGPFMDTAAIMKNLDLVITCDTSIAHLAGALGVPVWVALPYVCDWRWLQDRSDSPWYPTMRLFRQKQRGDWTSVFEEMYSQLRIAITMAAI